MVSAGALGVLIVVAIIGVSFCSYYVVSTPLDAQITSYQNSVSSLHSVISSMSANPSTTTIYSTITKTSTSTSTSTSTTTIYPIPNNVTFYLIYSNGCGNQGDYSISVNGHVVNSGSIASGTNSTTSISPLYQGENVSISFGIVSYYFTCTSTEQGYLYNNGSQIGYAEDVSNYNQQYTALITWSA